MAENMYCCWLYLTDKLKDAEVVWSRYVELPFVPTKGVTLQFAEEESEEDGFDFTPHNVVYCVAADVFWCNGEIDSSDCSCTREDRCCVFDDVHKEWMRKTGWTFEAMTERDGWLESTHD